MAIDELDQLRERFVQTLKVDVGSLIRLHERDAGGARRPGEWLRAIRRSAIVLIGANLENFVEDLVCTALRHLADHEVKARRYPEGYRIWRFRHTAQSKSLSIEDAKELVELSQKLYSEVRELRGDELLLDEIRETFANPTPKNINWIMSLLDKAEYVDELRVDVNRSKTNVASALHELASRRNSIAHGNADEDPDLEDVRRLFKFAQTFSTRIKRDVTAIIEKSL